MSIEGLQVDITQATPVYRQIADGIRAAADEGRLEPGDRLPPTRDLARTLGVNRNTVIAAYEALAADRVVVSHTGRGTFLVDALPADEAGAGWSGGFARAVDGPGVGALRSIYRLAVGGSGISFAGSYPAPEWMPLEEFRAAMDATLRDRGRQVLSYGSTAGMPELRETLAASMRARGADVDAGRILVTNGAQQAIEITLRALVDPGDSVAIEEPTYTGALSVLRSLGARLAPVPVDDGGIVLDRLAAVLERRRPRVLYVQPTFHNPTGAVMDRDRRGRLLQLAAAHRCTVIEDDWGSDLEFGDAPPESLFALDGGANVVYLSTFSKKLIPGLRIGWLAAPPEVHERLLLLKQIEDFGTSPLIQAALQRFLADGGLERHLERIRPAYRERRNAVLAALGRHLPGASWTEPHGGLFVWVTLPRGLDSNALFVAARDRGVAFSRGGLFHADGSGRGTLRLAYGSATPQQIEEGIEKIGELVRSMRPSADPADRGAADAVPIL